MLKKFIHKGCYSFIFFFFLLYLPLSLTTVCQDHNPLKTEKGEGCSGGTWDPGGGGVTGRPGPRGIWELSSQRGRRHAVRTREGQASPRRFDRAPGAISPAAFWNLSARQSRARPPGFSSLLCSFPAL